MTPGKAIEILTNLDRIKHFAEGDDVTPAIRLGIEALKLHEARLGYPQPFNDEPLPGESKD